MRVIYNTKLAKKELELLYKTKIYLLSLRIL